MAAFSRGFVHRSLGTCLLVAVLVAGGCSTLPSVGVAKVPVIETIPYSVSFEPVATLERRNPAELHDTVRVRIPLGSPQLAVSVGFSGKFSSTDRPATSGRRKTQTSACSAGREHSSSRAQVGVSEELLQRALGDSSTHSVGNHRLLRALGRGMSGSMPLL